MISDVILDEYQGSRSDIKFNFDGFLINISHAAAEIGKSALNFDETSKDKIAKQAEHVIELLTDVTNFINEDLSDLLQAQTFKEFYDSNKIRIKREAKQNEVTMVNELVVEAYDLGSIFENTRTSIKMVRLGIRDVMLELATILSWLGLTLGVVAKTSAMRK